MAGPLSLGEAGIIAEALDSGAYDATLNRVRAKSK
jgi:hypothetical protein